MGLDIMRNMPDTIVIALVMAAAACSLTLDVAAQGQANCASLIQDRRTLGQCIDIHQCEYFMRLLSGTVSQSDRNLLRNNQCNQQQTKDVYVCCPLNDPDKRKDGLEALRHSLLPTECGAVRWQRSNDTETKIKEFPWLALIEYTKPSQEKLHACGGVLISERYVLTAAHCIAGPSVTNMGWQIGAVRLGEWDTMTNPDCQVTRAFGQTECAPPYQDVPIENTIVHPLYDKNSVSQPNDIAMIRLKDPARMSDFVQPICLPNQQLRADELEGLVADVAGWKATSSSRMQKSEVIISSIEKCQQKYASQNVQIRASQLCGAASANECQGNSGGPLMVLASNVYLLGGILSFGPVPCPSPGWPDIYTRVASYIDWIHGNLKP